MLSKADFNQKHQAKFDKAGLSKAERSKRYKQYQLTFAMKTQGVVGRSKQAAEPFRENRVLNTSYSNFSQCTKDYATALMDPWNVVRPPCVPDTICLPSYKFGVRARGTFVVGLQGTGFVFINPYVCYGGTTAGFRTDASFNSQDVEGGGITGNDPFFNDSPFVAADFGAALNQSRLVGAGLRARYTGTEINRSGQAVIFRSPTNRDFLAPGSQSVTNLLTYKETSTAPVDRDWHYAVWRPTTATDIAYANPVDLEPNFCLLVAIFGGQPGQSFEFDYVSWFEIVGNNLPNLTRSHSDPIGMSAVSMAMPLVQPTRNPNTTLRSFLKEMAVGVSTAMSFMPRLPGQAGMLTNTISDLANVGSYLL